MAKYLIMMSSSECNFCEPSSFSERMISSNEHAISLLSSPRLVTGHSLVIPKRHSESLDDLSSDEVQAIHELISPIYRRLLGTIALGVDVWQKTRPSIDQDGVKMNHVHFHILPSNPGEEAYTEALRWSRDKFEPLSLNEQDAMLDILT